MPPSDPTAAEDRRLYRSRVGLATLTLFVLIAGHAVRETARDALFLTDLPATQLPWAYLSIALGAVVVGVANRFLLSHVSHRRLLVATLGLGVAGDLVFWWLVAQPLPGASFALYTWTGLLGTAVTLQLWLHLGEALDVGEARRAFPWVAAGGLAGAVLGALVARGLLEVLDTRALLLASAAFLVVSAAVAAALPTRRSLEPEARRKRGAALREVLGHRYLRQLTLLALSVAAMATGADYLFKSAVAAHVPTAELGRFFAVFHAAVNTGALGFDLLLASWMLRQFGVPRTQAALPALVLSAAVGLVALGGFAAAAFLKISDGVLRPSIYKASTELLFQPLSRQARNAAKTVAESFGARGGQALGSLLILGAVSFGVDARGLAVGVAVAALLALWTVRGLKWEYVARLRERVSGFSDDARAELPRLDLYSLEALVSNLRSPEESEVLAALELLRGYGRESLVPPLLLHHPSTRVALKTLEILQSQDPPHLASALRDLLSHDEPRMRAAVLNALVARAGADPPLEEIFRTDDSSLVRSTALVALAARHRDPREALTFLAQLFEQADDEERIAVARSLPRLAHEVAGPIAERIASDGDPRVAEALAEALAAESEPAPAWIPTLIRLLAIRRGRPAARTTLLRLGEPAMDALAEALADGRFEPGVRRHLPRSIHRFATPAAARLLAEHLASADSGVRYKILRALGRMRADDPALEIPEEAIETEARRSLDRAIDLLALRVGFFAARQARVVDSVPGEDLLGRVLAEKETRALERVFRALHILQPRAEFAAIFEALQRAGESSHADGLELVESLVEGELRNGLLAMVADASDAARLRAAAPSHGSVWARELARALPEEDKPLDGPAVDRIQDGWPALVSRLCGDSDPILAAIAEPLAATSDPGSARAAAGREPAR